MPPRTPKRPPALGQFPDAVWNPANRRWEEGEFWYDEKVADASAAFFPKYLRFTKGEWAGRPFTLEAWEEHDIVRPMFGWKRADGTRRFRRVVVWVPRKNGKTELAAGVGLLTLLGDGEPGGEVYAIASDKNQASIVFNIATTMVQWSPELRDLITPLKTALFCEQLGSAFKPLSGQPEGKHGLNASGVIGDEVHEWSDDRLYTFVHQSEASRRQPLEFLISTSGEMTGYGWELWNYCQSVREGGIADPEILIVTYAAPKDADWTDPKTWKIANPNLGVSVKLAYLAAECAKAKESPRLENHFKRYHLNIWTEQAVRWLNMETWDACKGRADWSELETLMRGRRCFGGADLSQTVDLTALCYLFPPDDEVPEWVALWRYFVPELRVDQRVRRDRVPYDHWIKTGALKTTPGNVVDYTFIQRQIEADASRFQIENMGFDPWNAMQLMLSLQGEGLPVEQVRQGYLTLSGPTKEIERLVLDSDFCHGGHPVSRWCAANVAVETDASGNIKPSKAKSTERIDGMAALVTAGALAFSEGSGPMVWTEADAVMVV